MSGLFYLNDMGLFSGNKNKKTYVSASLGEFTLIFSNGPDRIWGSRNPEMNYVVRGNDEAPFAEQMSFLEKIHDVIEESDREITNRLKQETKADFISWKERFKVTNVEVVEMSTGGNKWNIGMEDLQKRSFRCTLFIEGDKVVKFSVDD
jgi:hypothetical protein